jgi:hypothetical protein
MRARGRGVLIDPTDEAEPAFVQGADQALILAGVADGAPRRADPRAERRLRDDTSLPDGVDQLVLAHHSSAVPDQVEQEVENLRLDGNDPIASAQLMPPEVDLAVAEAQGHLVLLVLR